MAESNTYSLWLRPFEEVAYKLEQQIKELSEKYNTPSFEPHVTLLGGLTGGEVELQQLTDTLAASLEPFDIVLTHIGYKDTYFQSLFIHAEESSELMNARNRAEEMFKTGSDKEFMPHLSLMYGDFPREEKERIINSIGRDFQIRFTAHNLMLIQTQGKPDAWKKSHSVEFKETS